MSGEPVLTEEDDESSVTSDFSENYDELLLLDFEEYLNLWRSCVQVTNTILQCRQCDYLNELFNEKDLSDVFVDKWEGYCDNWRKCYCINSILLDDLKRIQTKNALEEDQKNSDIKYLTESKELLYNIYKRKLHHLTILPSIPAIKMTFASENDENDKYAKIFHNLLHFYVITYKRKASSEKLVELNVKIFKNILKKKKQFEKFIKTFMPNDENVWQRWKDLNEFLTIHFSGKTTSLKNKENELKQTIENKKFYLFLKLLLNKDELEKKIQKLPLYELFYEMYYHLFFHTKLPKDGVNQLFLTVLLDIQVDFKKFITSKQKLVEKSLNMDFQNKWRRMLHLPMTVLKIHQYQIFWCYLPLKKFSGWLDMEKNAIYRFQDILPFIIDCVRNIFVRIEILKNLSTIEYDQLIADSEILNELFKTLSKMHENRLFLHPLPSIVRLNEVPLDATNTNEYQLNHIVFNLHYFYKLFLNQKQDFVKWNQEMLDNIKKKFDTLNDFINDFIKIQNKDENFSLLWKEFQIFIKEKNCVHGQDRFSALYEIIFDKNLQLGDELQSVSPMEFKYEETTIKTDKMHQIKIYIILVLNGDVDLEIINKHIILNSNLNMTYNTIILQLVNSFMFFTPRINKFFNNNFCSNRIYFEQITHAVEILKDNDKTREEFEIYNNLLITLKNASQNEDILNSIEILKELENKRRPILSLELNQNAIDLRQNIILSMYCYWRVFRRSYELSKLNFCKWCQKIFKYVLSNLNTIDFYVNTTVSQDSNNSSVGEKWNCLKKLALQFNRFFKYNSDESSNHELFASFLDDYNLCFSEELEYLIHKTNIRIFEYFYDLWQAGESELLIFILLDSPNLLKQTLRFICWQNMVKLNNIINCKQFYYLKITNNDNDNKSNIIKSLRMHEHQIDIKDFNKCLLAFEKLNGKSFNVENCLKEIEETLLETFFFSDEIPLIPNISLQLEILHDIVLIQFHQILYFEFYFQIIKVDELEDKTLLQKIHYMLEYIHKNAKEMDEFINNYFINFENSSFKICKSNWNLIKDKIHKLSAEDFNNCWRLIFYYCDQFQTHTFLRRYELYFKLSMKLNENDAAKYVLLILLNMPLGKIAKIPF